MDGSLSVADSWQRQPCHPPVSWLLQPMACWHYKGNGSRGLAFAPGGGGSSPRLILSTVSLPPLLTSSSRERDTRDRVCKREIERARASVSLRSRPVLLHSAAPRQRPGKPSTTLNGRECRFPPTSTAAATTSRNVDSRRASRGSFFLSPSPRCSASKSWSPPQGARRFS